MTVSRVINGREGVDAETQRKVEEAIEVLDYVPNRIARGLTSQKTATIGLIVPDVVNPFFSPVVRGAEATARRAGYRVLLCNSEGDLRLEREYIEDLVSHRVEGLLLAPANDQSRHNILPLLRREFPLVLIDRALPNLDCDLVVGDSASGARRLVEHLLAVGHRDIAHITDADDTSTGVLGREAGEGPRAQTYEHLAILRLLGVDQGVVAVPGRQVERVDPHSGDAGADDRSADRLREARSAARDRRTSRCRWLSPSG